MGGSHAHRDHSSAVPVPSRPRLALLAALALAFLATVGGLVALWPHGDAVPSRGAEQFTAPGVSFPHADVVEAQPPCPTQGPQGDDCGKIVATVGSGPEAGTTVSVTVPPEVSRSGLGAGDSVELVRTPPTDGRPAAFSFFSVDRSAPLWILAGIFVLVVALVAQLRGLLALVGLGFSGMVVVKFMLPALLAGESGLAVALVGSSAIMFVVLYLAHGVSLRTSTALAGTLVGVSITAFVGLYAVQSTRLSGVTDETGSFLTAIAGELSFQGLLTCAIIIAGLGVLNDVTITQTSAVWELRAAAPELSRRQLFTSAMRIGRDHIASTIYTIVFAYAGSALTVLLLLFLYDRPFVDLLSTEDITEEVVRTLASSIGLVVAVPVTTLLAVAMVSPNRRARTTRDTPNIGSDVGVSP